MLTSEIARADVESLWGRNLSPTMVEILQLNEMGLRIEFPDDEQDDATVDGVQCGNVTLYPFTLQSSLWFAHVACKLFATDQEALDYALAYALAHGRTEGAFDGVTGYKRVAKSLNRWAMRTTATLDQLRKAFPRICPMLSWIYEPSPPGEKRKRNVVAETEKLASFLVAAGTGRPRAYWMAATTQHVSATVDQIAALRGNGESTENDNRALVNGEYLSVLAQITERCETAAQEEAA